MNKRSDVRRREQPSAWWRAGAPLIALTVPHWGLADDACAAFKWDLSRERALFDSHADAVVSTTEPQGAVTLLPDRLYALRLASQDAVHVLTPLGPKAQFSGAFAGLASFRVTRSGSYRVSLDQGAWIDIVGPSGPVAAADFTGATGCSTPHKSVKFGLTSGAYVLQVSAAHAAEVRLTITASE